MNNMIMSKKAQELIDLLEQNEQMVRQLELICKEVNMSINRKRRDMMVLTQLEAEALK